MHRCGWTCRALAALSLLLGAARVQAQTIGVPRGDSGRVAAIVDWPAGDGPVAAVVLAPGQGYHMSLPAMEATARALAAQGLAVFRFDWTFFTAKAQPSADLSQERQDLQAVVAAARAHPRVDPARVSVGGKSLGSVVAWQVFAGDPRLHSAVLLTPLCSRTPPTGGPPRPEARQYYPGFEADARPTLWVIGDADPRCQPALLYAFVAGGSAAARVAVVGGDHSFENPTLPPSAAEAFRARNVGAVAAVSAAFAADLAGRPAP